MKKVLVSVWFWWLILTGVYFLLFNLLFSRISPSILISSKLNLLGQFVPIGPITFGYIIDNLPGSLTQLVLFIILMTVFCVWQIKNSLSFIWNLLLVFIFLFVLTLVMNILYLPLMALDFGIFR